MLLIKAKDECDEVIKEMLSITYSNNLRVDYLAEDKALCAVSFRDCWYVDEDQVEWYKGDCACSKFSELRSEELRDLVDKLVSHEKIEFIAATPIPFTPPEWGPSTILDAPARIVAMRIVPRIDETLNDVCLKALLTQGLVVYSREISSCQALLNLVREHSDLFKHIEYREKGGWIFIERVVSDDYCRYLSESRES